VVEAPSESTQASFTLVGNPSEDPLGSVVKKINGRTEKTPDRISGQSRRYSVCRMNGDEYSATDLCVDADLNESVLLDDGSYRVEFANVYDYFKIRDGQKVKKVLTKIQVPYVKGMKTVELRFDPSMYDEVSCPSCGTDVLSTWSAKGTRSNCVEYTRRPLFGEKSIEQKCTYRDVTYDASTAYFLVFDRADYSYSLEWTIDLGKDQTKTIRKFGIKTR
jgi:hypothetical protein